MNTYNKGSYTISYERNNLDVIITISCIYCDGEIIKYPFHFKDGMHISHSDCGWLGKLADMFYYG